MLCVLQAKPTLLFLAQSPPNSLCQFYRDFIHGAANPTKP